MARYSSSRYWSSRSSSRSSSRYTYRNYGYGGFAPYVTVAEKKQRAEQAARELRKGGHALHPIEVAGREICHTWWGLSWCRNLENFGDYANRLPRGRSYVRCGAVIDLQIGEGVVRGLVQGSDLYKVEVRIKPLPDDRRQDLCDRCAADIGSTIDLLSGKLDRNIMNILAEPKRGLFPEPRDIDFQCSCPDHASVCKHVAAVLYGIGVRFDADPELFFTLRGVDPAVFAAAATTAGLDVPVAGAGIGPAPDTLAGASVQELGAVFGIELSTRSAGGAAAPGAAAAIATRTAMPRASGPAVAPMPKDPRHELSAVDAYVASLFDPHTGRPVDVDAPPPRAAAPVADRPGNRSPARQVLPRLTRKGTVTATQRTVMVTTGFAETKTANPAPAKPSGGKGRDRKPARTKPVATKAVTPKPARAKPVTARAAPAKPAGAKPVAGKAVTANPARTKPVAGKAVTANPAPAWPAPAKPAPAARRAAARSGAKPSPSPVASRKVLDLCQPHRLLKMADLRALGIPYAAVQRALDTGHLEITGWRGEYTTTRTTADWLRSRGLL